MNGWVGMENREFSDFITICLDITQLSILCCAGIERDEKCFSAIRLSGLVTKHVNGEIYEEKSIRKICQIHLKYFFIQHESIYMKRICRTFLIINYYKTQSHGVNN